VSRHKARYWTTVTQRGNSQSVWWFSCVLSVLFDFTWLAAD